MPKRNVRQEVGFDSFKVIWQMKIHQSFRELFYLTFKENKKISWANLSGTVGRTAPE